MHHGTICFITLLSIVLKINVFNCHENHLNDPKNKLYFLYTNYNLLFVPVYFGGKITPGY